MSKSIIQKDTDHCFICGRARGCPEMLDSHHVFGGAYRDKSEKYGLTVFLCHSDCHIFGVQSVHRDRTAADALKATAQRIAMERYGWGREEFVKKFGKNYI